MIRANTGGIVALMANVQFGGEWPVMKLPRKTMGADYLAIPARVTNDTIAAERLCGRPYPAITRLVYTAPKAVNEGSSLVCHM
jgi:hypothetical protein